MKKYLYFSFLFVFSLGLLLSPNLIKAQNFTDADSLGLPPKSEVYFPSYSSSEIIIISVVEFLPLIFAIIFLIFLTTNLVKFFKLKENLVKRKSIKWKLFLYTILFFLFLIIYFKVKLSISYFLFPQS
jgi:hypothetical protein